MVKHSWMVMNTKKYIITSINTFEKYQSISRFETSKYIWYW